MKPEKQSIIINEGFKLLERDPDSIISALLLQRGRTGATEHKARGD